VEEGSRHRTGPGQWEAETSVPAGGDGASTQLEWHWGEVRQHRGGARVESGEAEHERHRGNEEIRWHRGGMEAGPGEPRPCLRRQGGSEGPKQRTTGGE
jgi:hypothetical protein